MPTLSNEDMNDDNIFVPEFVTYASTHQGANTINFQWNLHIENIVFETT